MTPKIVVFFLHPGTALVKLAYRDNFSTKGCPAHLYSENTTTKRKVGDKRAMNRRQTPLALTVAAFAVLCLCVERASAAVTYDVSVDTSTLSGQSGNLDFQFNPGDLTTLGATATVTDFTSLGATLIQPATLTGGASGSLPGTLTLVNSSTYNDIFQGITFSSSLSFEVTLSGEAIDNPGGSFGSSFLFSLYAADGTTPLLTTDSSGSVVTVNLNPNGTTGSQTFPSDNSGGSSVGRALPQSSSAVPEPSTFALMAFGFAGLMGRQMRRRSTTSQSAV